MFGWLFPPRCPCDPAAKAWVEDRLRWLTRQFGLHLLIERPIVLPTDEFFPDPYDGTPRAAQAMFRRVCGYMGVDPRRVDFEMFDDPTPSTTYAFDPERGFAAGYWEDGLVSIERGALDRPADLIGTMAHELAHQRLIGEGRVDPRAPDNELLTDLTAVYHGFGVFLANNRRKHIGKLSHWPGTKLVKPEYISEPILGYALAHFAWFRDEPSPAWASALNWAPHAVFKQGLRWLTETKDSAFQPVRLRLHTEDDG